MRAYFPCQDQSSINMTFATRPRLFGYPTAVFIQWLLKHQTDYASGFHDRICENDCIQVEKKTAWDFYFPCTVLFLFFLPVTFSSRSMEVLTGGICQRNLRFSGKLSAQGWIDFGGFVVVERWCIC